MSETIRGDVLDTWTVATNPSSMSAVFGFETEGETTIRFKAGHQGTYALVRLDSEEVND
jgi:hypothetical protein